MAIDESGKVTFTAEEQAKVDEIVKERLSRHKPEDYEDLKEISSLLEDFDFKGTPAEKKEALKLAKEARKESERADTYKDAVAAYEDVDELPPDSVIKALAKKWGKSPEVVEKALLKQVANDEDSDRKEAETKQWREQVKVFEDKHPDVDLEKLSANQKFLKFVRGKKLPLVELYADFVEFVGEQEAELETLRKTVQAKDANAKNAEKSTGSAKGEAPQSEFISKAEFDKNKDNREWTVKNFERIMKSRPKWGNP
jgi:hypothetical protein